MNYELDELIKRTETGSVKWDGLRKSFPLSQEGALPLWVADMDFACAKPIQEALHKRIDQQIYGYTIHDEPSYKEAVISWFQRRFQWTIDPEDIFFSPGVVPAIAFLIRILSKPGQGIIIQEPVYYPFTRNITENDRIVVNNQLVNEHGHYRINFKDLEEKFSDDNTAGMILCSPHNPVGRVWTLDELQQIAILAKKYNKWIIADEIHCDLIRSNVHFTPFALAVNEMFDQFVICTAPSKSFNLAGLQISNIIIHNKEYQKLWIQETAKRNSISSPNVFAHTAVIAAYEHSEDWLDQVNHYIDENVKFAKEYLNVHLPHAIISPCEGTYLLWIDVRYYCQDHKKLEEYMQRDANVILDEGYLFGKSGIGFERVNLACPRSIVEEALHRMCIVLNRIKQS